MHQLRQFRKLQRLDRAQRFQVQVRAPTGLLFVTIETEWESAVIPAGVVGLVGAMVAEDIELGFHCVALIEGEAVDRLGASVDYHMEIGVVRWDDLLGARLLGGGGDGQKREGEEEEEEPGLGKD